MAMGLFLTSKYHDLCFIYQKTLLQIPIQKLLNKYEWEKI